MIRPAIDARSASFSESLPSVAETWVRSTWTNSIGRAPVCSTSARSLASSTSPMPVICAPLSPGMPSGLSSGSTVGADLILPSSTIAKLSSTSPLPCEERKRLLSTMSRVTSWNLSAPLSVKSISTIASPFVPKSWRVPESFRSSPVISGTGCSASRGW